MYISNEEYGIAMEMLTPVEEAFGKGMKAMMSQDSKEGSAALREARKLKRKGDTAGAKKKYQECITKYKKVRQECAKIEDETALDWFISLFLKPWWYLLYQGIQADFDFKGLTRESALKEMDNCIRQVEREMQKL